LTGLSGLVEDGRAPGTLAGSVGEVVRAVRSAVLGGLVELSAEQTDETAFVGGVPGGVAGDALALVVEVGSGSRALTAVSGVVVGGSVEAAHAGLVGSIPSVGSDALDAFTGRVGVVRSIALTDLGCGVPGLVG
jgi:hypothetical protein